MSKENGIKKKEMSHLFFKNEIFQSISISYQTPQKEKQLIKPDFSTMLSLENKFKFKTNGIYKKRNILEPESPIKTPNSKYLTPIKIKRKDLFGTKKENLHFRELNLNKLYNEGQSYNYNKLILDNKMNTFLKQINLNENNNSNKVIELVSDSNKNNTIIKESQNRMEEEYRIIKKIYENKFDAAYIVKQKNTGKIYVIKKNSKKSKKNNFNTIQTIFSDMQKKDNNEIGGKFCIKYIDCWIENEKNEFINDEKNYMNINLYILLEYIFTIRDISILMLNLQIF